MTDPPTHATELLESALAGRAGAADELLPLVYDELRAVAGALLRRERADHTLAPTALVHEAYLRLVPRSAEDWNGRTHFKAVAVRAMRRLLVDHARARDTVKRGGGRAPLPLRDVHRLAHGAELDAVELHDALERMRDLDPRQTEIAEMRLLGGLSAEETAQLLGVSSRTVERDWTMARAWLRRELGHGGTT